MATLQKIRNKGPLLVIVIGLALFCFIASDAWRVFQPNQAKQNVGEINGKKISAQEYQSMVDEYTKVQEKLYGRNSNDEDLTQAKDFIWESYIQYTLIENEAQKVGLTVTDAEIKTLIKEGTSPLLNQTPFINPQTRQFDKEIMDYFVKQGNPEDVTLIMNYTENQLKKTLLVNKFQNLLMKSVISNPVEAEFSFQARTQQSDLLLAAIPYSSVADSTITISSSEIKDLYKKKKEQFVNTTETRNIKYIDVHITPSQADRQAVFEDVTGFSNELAETQSEFASFIRSTGSTVPFVDLPVTRAALPTDIANRLDSVSVGEIYGPFYTQGDDSFNAFKILSRQLAPDSIQFRQIQVYAASIDETKALADSIDTAIKGGADFLELAQKYGQTGQNTWIASRDYEGSQMDATYIKIFNKLNTLAPNETANIDFGQGNIIVQVVNRKGMMDKYKVAVIKRPVEFSKETYSKAYNDFSQFVSANGTLEKLAANAEENGYRLLERNEFMSNEHNVCGIRNTRDALRWVFDAKKNEVSPLYDCGDNDHLLVVAVSDINEEGYSHVEKVANTLKLEIMRDKKAALLTDKIKNAKSFEEVKGIAGVMTDTVKHVTFSAPTYVSLTHSSEPAIGGEVAGKALNQLSAPVKGNGGVYVFQIYNQEPTNDTFDVKEEEANLTSMNIRLISRYMGDLYLKNNIKDSRYLYF